jgi:two-component system chemotaxis sensor kinase CheA
MRKDNGEFRARLMATFQEEAREHLEALTAGLLELEKAPPDQTIPVTERIFREVHSLKGACRSVGLLEAETLCQSLETIFAALKRFEYPASPPLLDLLHKGADALARFLLCEGPEAALEKPVLAELADQMRLAAKDLGQPHALSSSDLSDQPAPVRPPSIDTRSLDTLRVPVSKLDGLLRTAEEQLSIKTTTQVVARELRRTGRLAETWQREWGKVSADVRALESTNGRPAESSAGQAAGARISEFLSWNREFVAGLARNLKLLTRTAEHAAHSASALVDSLSADIKDLLMLPFSLLLQGLPKMVRDLARDQRKEVDLVLQCEEVEVDRRILEEMRDPLMHILRNAVDHGIERPEIREKKQKSRCGCITMNLTRREEGKVEITISDDGAGVDVDGLKAAALRAGVAPDNGEVWATARCLDLIFLSGVSCAPMITDISGRGLGLAIAREKVQKLGGTLRVESRPGVGTTFHILLPVRLATLRGLLVRIAGRGFVVPLSAVNRVGRVKRAEIRTVENRETILLDGQVIPLVSLSSVLGLSSPRAAVPGEPGDPIPFLVIGSRPGRIGFSVDQVIGEQELLAKGFPRPLVRLRHISGACVQTDGEVVPILDSDDLLTSALRHSAQAAAAPAEEPGTQARKSILVVEDSITARTLLKTILETAGYRVDAAVDGMDALAKLRAGEFDLIVSDVDMPRMNGLDLTARIRGEDRLKALPVVLVTALETREDRERGIEVGADAYIVKSSFDQSDLLEVIARLV